jgi:hypothetical protein
MKSAEGPLRVVRTDRPLKVAVMRFRTTPAFKLKFERLAAARHHDPSEMCRMILGEYMRRAAARGPKMNGAAL